jgi:hypothetical protein
MINSRRIRWAGHVVRMGLRRCVGRPKEKELLERHKRR